MKHIKKEGAETSETVHTSQDNTENRPIGRKQKSESRIFKSKRGKKTQDDQSFFLNNKL